MITAISALVLALMLAVVSQAEATCAWVLWVENEIDGPMTYRPQQSFATQGDCDRIMLAAIEASGPIDIHPSLKATRIEKNGNSVTTYLADGRTMRSRFFCLPDTIDPRGAKGGGGDVQVFIRQPHCW